MHRITNEQHTGWERDSASPDQLLDHKVWEGSDRGWELAWGGESLHLIPGCRLDWLRHCP